MPFEVKLYCLSSEKYLRHIECKDRATAERMRNFVLRQNYKESEGEDAVIPSDINEVERVLLETHSLKVEIEQVSISNQEFIGFHWQKIFK